MKKSTKETALNCLNILSGFLGNNPKTNFIKEKLRKEIRKEHGNKTTIKRPAE